MFVIFGFRTRIAILATLSYICETCGVAAAHRVVRRRRWFTLFFIPAFPLGPGRCRLISRSRSALPRGAARLATWVMEPVTLVMTRKMLLGIKQRAERQAQPA